MTKLGETAGYGVSTFASEVVRYIGGRKLDYLLVNTAGFSDIVLAQYAAEDAAPVELDNGTAEKFAHQIVMGDLASIDGVKLRHHSGRLADAVMATIGQPAERQPSPGLD